MKRVLIAVVPAAVVLLACQATPPAKTAPCPKKDIVIKAQASARLGVGTTIGGTVFCKKGDRLVPVPNVEVTLFFHEKESKTKTDPNGKFFERRNDDGEAGTAQVTVQGTDGPKTQDVDIPTGGPDPPE